MKAVAWHDKRDVRVEEVLDPDIRKPDDVILRATSSGVCGSDPHLYEVMTPYLNPGHSSIEATREVLSGIADAEGEPPPPLEPARR